MGSNGVCKFFHDRIEVLRRGHSENGPIGQKFRDRMYLRNSQLYLVFGFAGGLYNRRNVENRSDMSFVRSRRLDQKSIKSQNRVFWRWLDIGRKQCFGNHGHTEKTIVASIFRSCRKSCVNGVDCGFPAKCRNTRRVAEKRSRDIFDNSGTWHEKSCIAPVAAPEIRNRDILFRRASASRDASRMKRRLTEDTIAANAESGRQNDRFQFVVLIDLEIGRRHHVEGCSVVLVRLVSISTQGTRFRGIDWLRCCRRHHWEVCTERHLHNQWKERRGRNS